MPEKFKRQLNIMGLFVLTLTTSARNKLELCCAKDHADSMHCFRDIFFPHGYYFLSSTTLSKFFWKRLENLSNAKQGSFMESLIHLPRSIRMKITDFRRRMSTGPTEFWSTIIVLYVCLNPQQICDAALSKCHLLDRQSSWNLRLRRF